MKDLIQKGRYILPNFEIDKDCLYVGSRTTYARVSSISIQLKYGSLCVIPYNCRSSHCTPTYQELWLKSM